MSKMMNKFWTSSLVYVLGGVINGCVITYGLTTENTSSFAAPLGILGLAFLVVSALITDFAKDAE